MAQPWPGSIPQNVNLGGFGLEVGETLIRTEMETGPTKVRRRFTDSVDAVACSMWLTLAQYTTFRNFYDVTLNGGAERFEFTDPITEVLTEYRFKTPPHVSR